MFLWRFLVYNGDKHKSCFGFDDWITWVMGGHGALPF